MVADPSTRIKRAFVTGATGIVGIPLCRELLAHGVQVTSYSRSSGSTRLPEGVDHVSGDILDSAAMESAVANADVIFHVAAAVHGSVSSAEEFMRINVDGTRSAIESAESVGAKLIFVSTVNVAGIKRDSLRDSYAESKAKAELLVLEAVDRGLTATIVRPATVFGNEQGRAGLVVDRLLAGSLKVLPGGGRKISPVWSKDLARALWRAAEIGGSGQIYTVAAKTMTTREFANAVCESSGLRKPFISPPSWFFAVPLQFAWWLRKLTRWTPPVSVGALLSHSVHDGTAAADELGFHYTKIADIFG